MKLTFLCALLCIALAMPSCKKRCYSCEHYNIITPAANNKPDFITIECNKTKRGIKKYEKKNSNSTYAVRCTE